MRKTDLPQIDVGGRIERLRGMLGDRGVDALMVTNPPNVRYLTGFTGSNGMMVVGPDRAMLLTDGRYFLQASDELETSSAPVELVIGKGDVLRKAVVGAVDNAARIGVEAGHISWQRKRELASKWFESGEIVATVNVVEMLRRVKDEGEIARIGLAARLADDALEAVKPMLLERPSERDFALALEFEMRRNGADSVWSPLIVAAGANAAHPHHAASDQVIGVGELIVIDFGCVVDGYQSDMTRTLCVGEPASALLQTMYDVVVESQRRAVDAIRAGMVGADVDRVARDSIASHDPAWAETMTHGSGHGIGLVIHEDPILTPAANETLSSGEVITMEPGVYLAGVGGVRIEDTLLVTDDGCRPLTTAPKHLVIESSSSR